MSVLPDSLARATEAGIVQSVPSYILTSRVIIAAPRRKLEWDGLAMVTKTLHTRRIIEGNEPIWAVKYKGLYYVAEGNHRGRAAHLWRQRRIAARLVKVPEGIELTPLMFFAISMIIGSRQPAPRQLSWIDNVSNVNRSIEEAKRHLRAAIARNESKQDPETMRLNRTSVGKVLFGPAFSKLSQDACVDPRRLNVDPLFNHSESGRVFWSGAVRLIQAGIMEKFQELVASRFKLQTKHLRLATRFPKEHLQRALAESSKDSSFIWDDLIPEGTTRGSQSPRSIPAESPVRTVSRQPRPKPTGEASRTEHESARQLRRIRTRSSSEHVHDGPMVPRKVLGTSHASVSNSAATDSNRQARPKPTDEAARTTSERARQPRRIQTRSASVHPKVPRKFQGPQEPSHAAVANSTAATNTNRGTIRPREEETSTTQAVKSRRLIRPENVEGLQSPPPTRSNDRGLVAGESASEVRGDMVEQSEDTQRHTNAESGCGVVGCKMGATSGMHKCRKCGADVHPYCCDRILGQPPQGDQTDPIYCSKCWTPSGVPQPLEKENTEETDRGNSGLDEKRMEEDRVAVNTVFKNLQQVEGVKVLLGNHDPAIKRDFEEIMNLARRAIRLTENIRTRIG